MLDQMAADVVRQVSPGRSEREQDAVASTRTRMLVRPVHEAVVQDDRVAGPSADCFLARLVFHSRVVELKDLPACIWKKCMQRHAATVRSSKNPERAGPFGRLAQVTEQRHLRGFLPEAERMIPAPPVLMPRQRRAARFLRGDIAGDPAQIVRGDRSAYAVLARSMTEDGTNHLVRPPQRYQVVVRALAAGYLRTL